MIEVTVKELQEQLQKCSPTARVIISGDISIVETKKLFGDTEDNEIVPTQKVPIKPIEFIWPTELETILQWSPRTKLHNQRKIIEFTNTLLSVWNPYTSIGKIPHHRLNGTTLSRALISTACNHQAIGSHNIDSLIDSFVQLNLEYFKYKYDLKNNLNNGN